MLLREAFVTIPKTGTCRVTLGYVEFATSPQRLLFGAPIPARTQLGPRSRGSKAQRGFPGPRGQEGPAFAGFLKGGRKKAV